MNQGLKVRNLQPELMDQPGLAESTHRRALDGLARVNRISGTVSALLAAIRRRQASVSQPLSVLDIACGGGDIAVRLAHHSKRQGMNLTISGYDISPIAIDYARSRADEQKVDIDFQVRDALAEIPESFDIIYSSLFLHHLCEADALKLLKNMRAATRQLLLISDLRRSRLGYWMAWLGVRFLSRSKIVHIDGPLSVQAAFTETEVSQLAAQADLGDAKIRSCWPERFLLEWSPS